MINQRHCPFCKTPAAKGCPHLALATEARDFVRHCVERCQGQAPWQVLCQNPAMPRQNGGWAGQQPDFTWLESAFCDRFLRPLAWFGGMDHEWRSGPRPEQGGFWVLMWSRDPQKLWWELREQFELQCMVRSTSSDAPPWLFSLNPK
jgi:hypothetical protein